jgi:hypothetical protein
MVIKHNVKSPVTMDYNAASVVPTRYVVYRAVKSIASVGSSIGLQYGLITVDYRKYVVVRHMQNNGTWSQWETLRLRKVVL